MLNYILFCLINEAISVFSLLSSLFSQPMKWNFCCLFTCLWIGVELIHWTVNIEHIIHLHLFIYFFFNRFEFFIFAFPSPYVYYYITVSKSKIFFNGKEILRFLSFLKMKSFFFRSPNLLSLINIFYFFFLLLPFLRKAVWRDRNNL